MRFVKCRLVSNISFLVTTKAPVLIINEFGTGKKLGKRSRTENTHLKLKKQTNKTTKKSGKDWLEN